MTNNNSPSEDGKVSDPYTDEETFLSKSEYPTPAEVAAEAFVLVSKEEAIAEEKKAGIGMGDYVNVPKPKKEGGREEEKEEEEEKKKEEEEEKK